MAFLGTLVLLLLGFAAVVWDGVHAPPPRFPAQVTRMTRLPRVSISAGWLEAPVPPYRDGTEEVFPGMRPINYQDFVYAR